MKDVIIKATSLCKSFQAEAGIFAKSNNSFYAVNNVSFEINRGETYGLVGESGCGKTTTARMLIRMYEANLGKIEYFSNGNKIDIAKLNSSELKKYRQKVKYVFQDPARSLNPRLDIFSILSSGLKYSSTKFSKDELVFKCSEILKEVGFSKEDLWKKPSEFSGGQRQRICIARGLIMEPDLLICDEVVSALDVSIQAQILNLLNDIRKKRNLSMFFITHDLCVASYFCDRIGVMLKGEIVEEASAETIFENAKHPYTKKLFEGAK